MEKSNSSNRSKKHHLSSGSKTTHTNNGFYVKLKSEDFVIYVSNWDRLRGYLDEWDDSMLEQVGSEVEIQKKIQ